MALFEKRPLLERTAKKIVTGLLRGAGTLQALKWGRVIAICIDMTIHTTILIFFVQSCLYWMILYESHLSFCSVPDACILNSDRRESRCSFYNIEDSKITTDNFATVWPHFFRTTLHFNTLVVWILRTYKSPDYEWRMGSTAGQSAILGIVCAIFLSPFILTWLLSKWRAWYSWSHHDFDKCRY